MSASTSIANQVGWLILGGVGMGPLVQLPLLAAQNAVAVQDMAVTSSSLTFFQSVGGLLATAVGQSIFNNGVCEKLQPVLDLQGLGPCDLSKQSDLTMDEIAVLNPPLYAGMIRAFTFGAQNIFWIGLAGAAATLVASLFMEHIPLRDGMAEHVHLEGAVHVPAEEAGLAQAAADEMIAKNPSMDITRANSSASPGGGAAATTAVAARDSAASVAVQGDGAGGGGTPSGRALPADEAGAAAGSATPLPAEATTAAHAVPGDGSMRLSLAAPRALPADSAEGSSTPAAI
jgi:hypothetical protein